MTCRCTRCFLKVHESAIDPGFLASRKSCNLVSIHSEKFERYFRPRSNEDDLRYEEFFLPQDSDNFFRFLFDCFVSIGAVYEVGGTLVAILVFFPEEGEVLFQ